MKTASFVPRTFGVAVAALCCVALLLSACSRKQEDANAAVDQDLLLTIGGFMRDNAEGGTLTGECSPGAGPQELACEIYNGIQGWTVTQVSIQVDWAPALGGRARFYRPPILIESFKSGRVSITVESPLPANSGGSPSGRGSIASRNWSWAIVGARGYRAKT